MSPPTPPAVALPWALGVWHPAASPAAKHRASLLPPPEVPPEDRRPSPFAALLGLAVALDVLRTRTRRLGAEQGAGVLAHLAEVAWEVGAHGGTAPVAELLELAETGEACARARVSQQMCQALAVHAAAAAAPAAAVLAATSSPETVLACARTLEVAAERVVQEACLNLASRANVDYRAI